MLVWWFPDQRGAYVTKDGKILELKGILTGDLNSCPVRASQLTVQLNQFDLWLIKSNSDGLLSHRCLSSSLIFAQKRLIYFWWSLCIAKVLQFCESLNLQVGQSPSACATSHIALIVGSELAAKARSWEVKSYRETDCSTWGSACANKAWLFFGYVQQML